MASWWRLSPTMSSTSIQAARARGGHRATRSVTICSITGATSFVAEHVDGGLHGVAGVVTDLAGVGGVGQVLAQAGGYAHRVVDLPGDYRAAGVAAVLHGACPGPGRCRPCVRG